MSIKPVSKKLKKALFVVDEDEQKIIPDNQTFFVDGYMFGDRLLEGLMFEAKISEDRKTLTVFSVSNVGYLKTLNANEWMKAALNYLTTSCDYVFPKENSSKSSWMLFNEDQVKEYFPDLLKDE